MMVGLQAVAVACLLAWTGRAQDTPSLSRWGQAVAYIPSPPAMILQGGKSDTSNAYSYTSAPNSPEALYIPLDASFAISSPPIITLPSNEAPSYAWHTLTPFSNSNGKWDLLSFGGVAGPSEPTQRQSDSTWYLAVDPIQKTTEWQRQPSGWGNQPSRRIYHSAVGGGGKVYITGGLRNDGSGIAFGETYTFDPASGFTQSAPLPRAVYHHSSVLLPNGTLIVFGGVSISMSTGVPAAQSLDTISVFDTTNVDAVWTDHTTSAVAPSPRRGMAAVLTSDGKEIFVNGGASTTFDQVYADSWTVDVDTLQWRQVGQSITGRRMARQVNSEPGPRYDHSAALGPDGQIVILGGYGGDGVADPGPFIFDLPEDTWSSEFRPALSAATSSPTTPVNTASASASAPIETASATDGQSDSAHTASSDRQSVGESASATISVSPTSESPSTSASQSSSNAAPMSLAAQLGLILGIVAVAALIVAILVWRYRRRRRHEKLMKAIYGSATGGPSRPYGDREKGGEGLMEEARQEEYNEYKNVPPAPPSPEKTVGLGMGTIKASFASLRNLRREQPSETYAVLGDEPSAESHSPVRQPTRRSGQGIRLLGPRSQRNSHSYVPVTSPPSIATGDSRRDMLSDEDSRNFETRASDWEVGEEGLARWKSARSILADQQEDPFEDDESLRPPIAGGPVPTPYGSRTNLDPFNERDISDGDFGLPYVDSEPLDLNGLLAPTSASHKRYSAMSGVSGPSSAVSDLSDGVVHYAYIGSPASTTSSPAETSYAPIKRTDTFFQRMAAGGITSLLSTRSIARTLSTRSTAYDIRDPAPPPSLWPVVSRDMMNREGVDSGLQPSSSGMGITKPPTAWKGEDLKPVRPTHHHGPSLTSITSTKSMRDMVIVQREPTDSSAESAIIETTSPQPMAGPFDDRHDVARQGGETPESIIFDGAAFANSPDADNAGSPQDQSQSRDLIPPESTVPIINAPSPAPSTPTSNRVRTSPFFSTSNTASPSNAVPPSGSPIPHPVLMHRRPVSEMVRSINKRGSGSGSTGSGDMTPNSLFSPQSRYSSPASTPRQDRVRPKTLYEAVKRDKLLVANPDSSK